MSKKPNQQSVDLMLLAMEVEKFDGPWASQHHKGGSRDLEIRIALSQPQFFNEGPYYEGAQDRIGMYSPDNPEQRLIPGNAPDMLVPRYIGDTDDARKLQPEGWHASTIIQDRWEPEQWYVALRYPGRDAAADAKCVGLAKAWTAAALKAQAMDAA